MELFHENRECCGCGACINICSKNAIQMREDKRGFRYPVIESTLCIDCNACKKVCPFKNVDQKKYPLEAYAATNSNIKQQMISASGGVFASVAQKALENGWIVWGASYEFAEHGYVEVVHKRITEVSDLYKLQGSKYVQSTTDNVFQVVREDIRNNKKVLFSGTPCQVAALKNYLGKNKDNLATIDIICHGVPSLEMFNNYLSEIVCKKDEIVQDFTFRNKLSGWGMTATAYLKRKNGKIKKKIIPSGNSSYFKLFLDSKIYRDSCYNCPYATKERVSDITLGDYWGIKKVHKDLLYTNNFSEERGISCVLVNTELGKRILNEFGNEVNFFLSSVENIAKENQQLRHPSIKPEDYDQIMDVYKKLGFIKFENELKWHLGLHYFKNYILAILPVDLKKKIKFVIRR